MITQIFKFLFASKNLIKENHCPLLKADHILHFRKNFLLKIVKRKKSILKKIQHNEYLSILEKGYKIRAAKIESSVETIITVKNGDYVRQKMKSDPFYLNYSKNS